MELLEGVAVSLLIKLLWHKYEGWRSVPPPPVAMQVVEASQSVQIPAWVTNTPEGCFVGISKPCRSLEEARQQAIDSAISQVLQAMGADYNLTHKSLVTANSDYIQHDLEERLTYTAKWFVNAIQQNIEESDVQQIQGKNICFVLVHLPQSKIDWFRRMTVGPKLVARMASKDSYHMVIDVRETNGIGVTLTDYRISITNENHHAGIVTMFVWKVPETSNQTYEGVIPQRCDLKGDSQSIAIPYSSSSSGLKALLLGTESQVSIVLRGRDEIGREVAAPVITR
ncbi:MAG: hypothetical protein SWH78_16815 [Thermodesulfobacteriota bacterium]|nr:hypothetical protein [Thermodesulfobacteriota bacterium]